MQNIAQHTASINALLCTSNFEFQRLIWHQTLTGRHWKLRVFFCISLKYLPVIYLSLHDIDVMFTSKVKGQGQISCQQNCRTYTFQVAAEYSRVHDLVTGTRRQSLPWFKTLTTRHNVCEVYCKWSSVFASKSINCSRFERVTSWHSPLSVIFNWFASRHFTKLTFFIADGSVLKSHFNVRTKQRSKVSEMRMLYRLGRHLKLASKLTLLNVQVHVWKFRSRVRK